MSNIRRNLLSAQNAMNRETETPVIRRNMFDGGLLHVDPLRSFLASES